MKGWIELCSDMDWSSFHGMWAKKAQDGSWYVLQFTNLVDAGGKDFADTPYECQVKRLDLTELSEKNVSDALRSCGWHKDGVTGAIVNTYDGSEVCAAAHAEHAIVECCIQYGQGAPLADFTGKSYPERVRAEARRFALECMKDADKLEKRLDRPVNAIGTSARNYGLGIFFASDRD